ncbi:MAG: SRPBCC family protein [Altibacter sp.]|uniref:SRPBCC family protein n=1 Tax=Altibacter sp. TaxID=2024823 RepID=UPI001DEFFE8D|nr:SRPBCC family protein [Altibacter sp.]MBZ0327079.1 SRPBCC family protein [Altibacter sp.]
MIVVYILLGILALLILLAIIAPKEYEFKRSIIIDKPVSEVFQYVKLVKNQDYWSPWKKRDPNMKQSFTGTDGTIGFISKWESDHKQVGAGEQEIKNIIDKERVETELRFLKPWKSVSNAYLITNGVDDSKTEVIWGFKGVNKVPFNIMMLVYNMDKAVGKDFEEGLTSLKELLEQK